MWDGIHQVHKFQKGKATRQHEKFISCKPENVSTTTLIKSKKFHA